MTWTERLFIAVSIAFVAGIATAMLWALFIDEPAWQADFIARCAAADMVYARQTRLLGGKLPRSWDYCVDRNGFFREIPPK